ncbi:sensor histidine kinase [Leucobacter insecticola]|uniref:sensor histidine kinase n=1 Tax=Leucobacter insecticola TaxID=2714934 RepID=UPI001FCA4EA2|nr:histidine kinase [Leucobacter insecticola]
MLTAILTVLAVVDAKIGAGPTSWPGSEQVPMQQWLLWSAFAILLPTVTAISLWWWDVVLDLDRARAAEARLAATQERLRVAGDVHDLQGHHLQVLALQLELTERLAATDIEAALEQLRAARLSVTAAQQGTRDLAHQFQSVPLGDEIANAADLLRAAGAKVKLTVVGDCEGAPAGVLGPVIRETTTNVLRHGGGAWARLSLNNAGGEWRYSISNDAGDASLAAAGSAAGSGLRGIARRVEEAGGSVEVDRGKQDFTVSVVLPGDAR